MLYFLLLFHTTVPTFSWNFTPAGSDEGQKLTTLTNAVSIKDFSDKDVGVYECVVTNEIVVNVGGKDTNGEETKIETFKDTRSVNITITGGSNCGLFF